MVGKFICRILFDYSPSLSFICIAPGACFKMPHGHNLHPSRPIDPLEYINDEA